MFYCLILAHSRNESVAETGVSKNIMVEPREEKRRIMTPRNQQQTRNTVKLIMTNLSNTLRTLTTGICLSVLATSTIYASSLIEPFLGEYKGHTEYEEDGAKKKRNLKRDLSVQITETDEGFNVSWEVTTIKANGKSKSKDYSIDFEPTKREHVFQAAQKTNVFGGKEPLDPMKGEPYVWSRIAEGTLTLFALLINDDGGYELLIYDRSLADKGLDLNFTRIKNGSEQKSINALLEKQ